MLRPTYSITCRSCTLLAAQLRPCPHEENKILIYTDIDGNSCTTVSLHSADPQKSQVHHPAFSPTNPCRLHSLSPKTPPASYITSTSTSTVTTTSHPHRIPTSIILARVAPAQRGVATMTELLDLCYDVLIRILEELNPADLAACAATSSGFHEFIKRNKRLYKAHYLKNFVCLDLIILVIWILLEIWTGQNCDKDDTNHVILSCRMTLEGDRQMQNRIG